jgi:hypothetical protein
VYRFDFDFAALETQYTWSDRDAVLPFTHFPCARFLTLDGSGWHSRLLSPAAELDPPAGVTMTLDSWDQDTVTATLAADSRTDWLYGERFTLQVCLDGVWYELPTMPGHGMFHLVALHLPAGEQKTQTFHLALYGALPAGRYRIAFNELSVEHTLV